MKLTLMLLCLIVSLFTSAGWMFRGLNLSYEKVVLSHARGLAEVVAQSRQTYAAIRGDDEPLPITFAHALAKRITSARVTIYSPYPFPTNEQGGLRDRFQRAAWDHLAKSGEPEYFDWDSGLLRYAVPDYMSAKCVACHNSAANTPKSDWKVGDVRGIIEVALPY